MILKDILNQPPASVLIEDTWLQKGRPLFLSLIRHYANNGFVIRYFKYDSPLSCEKFNMESLNISWHEMVVDPKQHHLIESISKDWISEPQNNHVIVALDSLSPLLLNWSIGDVASALRDTLKTKKLSLITLVHGDAHEKQTLKTLNHIFPCHLTLRKAQGQNLSSGIWRKASGKVIDCDEYYKVTNNWELTDVREATEATHNVVMEPLVKGAVPKSTFKLDLNSKEEEARSQVVLPYIRKQSETAASGTSKGQIIYAAEIEDWDDEDPDDDLEI